jgi:DNA-3-methyladenine glycosylase
MSVLLPDFFARDTVEVARDLIGATLIVGRCEGRIVETEAYTDDAASHAITRPNKAAIMRETYGHVYVYLIYGMHYCLNFTTEINGVGAVLIRAAQPIGGIREMIERRGTQDLKRLASGPGRLCKAFGIDMSFDGKPVGREVIVKARDRAPEIAIGPRVGITKAAELEWRFYERDNIFVSGVTSRR